VGSLPTLWHAGKLGFATQQIQRVRTILDGTIRGRGTAAKRGSSFRAHTENFVILPRYLRWIKGKRPE
jgi:hypothetical protein